MVAMSSFSNKDVRHHPPKKKKNTKATNIPKDPYAWLQSTQQRDQMEGRKFTGAKLYLDFHYLEINSREGTTVSQPGHPGESAGGTGNPAED